MRYAGMDERERVSDLKVRVISVPAAVNRLLNMDNITAPLTLSVVESLPEPYTVVVDRNAVEEVSAL